MARIKSNNFTVRIIGGKWRSRKVAFAGNPAIRPTPDRVRETLFNWLQADITGARCLELYAGSGALSLEALSRGARHVTLVDKCPQTVTRLRAIFDEFAGRHDYTLANDLADSWLNRNDERFDLIFVDPPFGTGELSSVLRSIRRRGAAAGYVYVEAGTPLSQAVPAGYAIHREGKAGNVHFGLLRWAKTR